MTTEELKKKLAESQQNAERLEHLQVAAIIAAGMLAQKEWTDKAIPDKAVTMAAALIDLIDQIY